MHGHILIHHFLWHLLRDYPPLQAQSGVPLCCSHSPFSNYCFLIRNHSRTFYHFNTRNNWTFPEAGLFWHFDIMNHIINFVLVARKLRTKLWLIKMNVRFQGINFKYFYSKIVKVLCRLTCIANFSIAFEKKNVICDGC